MGSLLQKAAAWVVEKSGIPHPFLTGGDSGDVVFGSSPGTRISNPFNEAYPKAAALMIATQLKAGELTFKDDPNGEALATLPDGLAEFWETPARTFEGPMSRATFLQTTVLMRKLAGAARWIMDESWELATEKNRRGLILAGQNEMQPVFHSANSDLGDEFGAGFTGWIYRPNRGASVTLLKEQVINLREVDPFDSNNVDGCAPWLAAKPYAQGERASVDAQRRLAEENGDLGPYIIDRAMQTNNAGIQQLKANLERRFRMRKRGKFEPTVIKGDIEIKQPEIKAAGSETANARQMDREAIFMAFGVPVSFAGPMKSNSVGMASEYHRLITDVVMPEAAELSTAMERVTRAWEFGGFGLTDAEAPGVGYAPRKSRKKRIYITFDFSNHEAMKQIREAKFKAANQTHRNGVDWETLNQIFGLGLNTDFPGSDVPFINGRPVRDILAANDEAAPQKSGSPTNQQGLFDEPTGLIRDFTSAAASFLDGERKAAEEAAADEDAEFWKAQEKRRAPKRKKLKGHLKTKLTKFALAPTLDKIEAVGKKAGEKGWVAKAGVAADLIFDPEKLGDEFVAVMRTIGPQMFLDGWKSANEEAAALDFEVGDLPTGENPAVLAFLDQRENLLKGAASTFHAEILETLEAGLNEGDTMNELAARVKSVFNEASDLRAEAIAATETGAAYEQARHESFVEAGVEWKKWVSSRDGRVRESHVEADNQIRGINEFYIVGEDTLLYPGDSENGSAKEVIRCRCISKAVRSEDG